MSKGSYRVPELGDPHAAWGELERVPAECQDETIVLLVRHEIYMELEQWDEAAEIAQFLIQKVPDEPFHYINLAMAEVKRSGFQTAENILQQALKAFPDHPNINYNLACYSAQLGKIEEAKRLLAIAIELDPIFRELALEDEDLKPIW